MIKKIFNRKKKRDDIILVRRNGRLVFSKSYLQYMRECDERAEKWFKKHGRIE